MANHPGSVIRIVGARQHNLRNIDLDLPLGELIVITGVLIFLRYDWLTRETGTRLELSGTGATPS